MTAEKARLEEFRIFDRTVTWVTAQVFRLMLTKHLNYKFYGGYNAKDTGFFQGKVSSYFWNKLTTQLEKSHFRKLSSEYSFGYTDILH